MGEYWGMEFVEVIDPKQPEGTRVDGMTYALLSGVGYYENLKVQCYREQFPYVFYKSVIEPALLYLEQFAIEPMWVSVTELEDRLLSGIAIQIEWNEAQMLFNVSYHMLTEEKFPEYAARDIAYRIQRDHDKLDAKLTYALMSDSQRQYLDDVMTERGFDELSNLYFHPHFREFRDKGMIGKAYGMYWMPTDKMIRVWQYKQDD